MHKASVGVGPVGSLRGLMRKVWARSAMKPMRLAVRELSLSRVARRERDLDTLGVSIQDPGIERAINEGVAWLFRAQDHSTSADGGVARHYGLATAAGRIDNRGTR